MAETFPNETLNWNSYSGYITDNQTFDTGGTVIRVNIAHTSTTGTYVSPTTGGSTQTGLPFGTKTMMSQAGAGQTTNTTFTFGDDSSVAGTVNTAENLSFRLYGIDGSTSDGYGDAITLRAVDADGNPVKITVTAPANATYEVKTNADGSVTITGTEPFVAPNTVASSALITFGGPVDSFTISHTATGGSGQVYMGSMSFTPSSALCFVAGTLVRTPTGEVAVETLKVGDLVMTRDNGAQPVRWIDSTRRALRAGSRLAPVRIRAGALGDNLPESDLLVSPQHRMLVRSAIAQRMFGTDEVLVAAKQLLQIDGIDIADDLDEVVYVHFIFDRHEIVYANGAESESLYTGPEALKTLSLQAREEILALFPELVEDALPEPARVLASGRLGRKLAVRHAQNDKPLVG